MGGGWYCITACNMSRMEHSSVREKRGEDVLEKGRRWVKDGEMRDGEENLLSVLELGSSLDFTTTI